MSEECDNYTTYGSPHLPDVWQYHGEGQVQRAYPSDAPETHAHKEHSSTHEKGIMGEWTGKGKHHT